MTNTNEQIQAAHEDMERAVAWGRTERDYEDLRRFVERRIEDDEQALQGGLVGNPFRSMAECEAKRSLFDACDTYPTDEGERTLKILARIYRFHPNYESAWAK
ncbi:DUF6221 family protein [Arthrobacter sp. YN]|uniref:DUF6221 family protein n=1 Tax=Arthrobacter sp. YN TaxID=2020486 RepID=UPI000B611808|nr:DUF6221 family protein [Arthrobacter sp. YN]ASN20720.1 hypothetical protein CGK93_14285 [Arthrobacter sp. YN]